MTTTVKQTPTHSEILLRKNKGTTPLYLTLCHSGIPRNFQQGVCIQAFTKLLPVADPVRANPAIDFGLPPTKKKIIVV